MQTDGKALRQRVPRGSHAEWSPTPDRADPVVLLEQQDQDRLQWLVPERHSRMLASAFAFYRGAARIMAADLAATPRTGLMVQACGDAHIANFGVFASPERQLVFDVNDFDETLPGPWEWDVKRLAASFTVAGRHAQLEPDECREVAEEVVRIYRQSMASLATKRTLDLWYTLLGYKDILAAAKADNRERTTREMIEKAETRDSVDALHRYAEKSDGGYRLKSEPPDLVPLRELESGESRRELEALVRGSFEKYKRSLPDHCRRLLDRFAPVDAALKVVGVGSVGTRCFILMLKGRGFEDPLFLQIKEASRSVLEEFLEPSRYPNHGQRVVEGQRLMQTVSDIFLGWGDGHDGIEYYWRQLRDWKGSADLEETNLNQLHLAAHLCGRTLARAHARSGEPAAIAAYLGSSARFDRAIADFAERYADQNERDYRRFKEAASGGSD